MFTKEQRKVLNSLSKEVFGTESRWQKMIKDPKFRIVTESHEDPDAQKYVQLSVKRRQGDRRGGTILKQETAVKLGLLKPDQVVANTRVVKTREPNYEELVSALEANLDMLLLSHVEVKEDQSMVFAKRLVDGNLLYKVSLLLDGTKEDFDGLVAASPENLREYLNSALVEKDADTSNSTVFDAVTFVSNVVFAASHKEEAETQVASIMDIAKGLRLKTIAATKKAFAVQRLAK